MAQKPRAPRASRGKKDDATASASVTANGHDAAQTPAAGHNGMDDDFRQWCRRAASARQDTVTEKRKVDTAREAFNRANGFYRKELALAKKAGHDPEDIIWWLNNKDRDPAEIDRETRARNRIARLMGMPIGTQLGLLDDDVTVATAVDNDANQQQGMVDADDLDGAEAQGLEAGEAAKPSTECPYEEGSPREIRWMVGHSKGQAKNIAVLAGSANGAAAATH